MRSKWVIIVIVATILINFTGGGIDFFLRLEIMLSRVSTTTTHIGILLAILSAVGFIVLGPFGRLSDMYGRRKFILSWIILSFIPAFYAFFAYSLPSLYAIGLPRTLLFNLGWIAILAWIADEVAEKERGKVLSILTMGSMTGVVIGPVFLSSLNDVFGDLNVALIASSALSLALTIPLAFLPEPSGFEPQASKAGGLRGLREILHDTPLFILSFSSLMLYAIGAATNFVMGPFLENYYGLTELEISGVIMFMGGFTAVGFILTGFLMDKWVGMRKRLVVFFLTFCGIFLVLGPFILTRSLLLLMVTLPILGFILGVLFPAFLVLMTDYSPKYEAGTELGTFQSISTFGFVIGNALAGYLWDTGKAAYGAYGGLLFNLGICALFAFFPIPLIMYEIREKR